ncbi:FliA/WhiG family RNA polymerase sigma factor [uncultured Marinococcus sp.]|uniref:FliA/WhiG family RNA polymerase sigma factor n=1 Tax=uncultured Marinococcus sp. TaxID=487012 RepID=UPI00262335A7|nr:FliA/WhiG family RNA polymerase sigma factor [uncultured Marinococcus sp.]
MSRSTAHAHQEIWEKWLDNYDDTAADQLVDIYMPLVHYHVQRIAAKLPKNVNRDDLVSHGLMGLYDAMKKFDLSRDLKFDTYASFRIRGAIIDGLRQEDWMPRSLREKTKKIEETAEWLEQKKGRFVSDREIGEELDMKSSEVSKVIAENYFVHMLSMDEATPDGERDETYRGAIVDHNAPSPEEMLTDQASLHELGEAIANLPEKEQKVVSLFYLEEMTLTEIGHILSLSTSRISQIHSKALFRLRQYLKQTEEKT